MWNDLLGKPFKDGARGPDSFDCWGLVQYIFKTYYNCDLPDYRIPAKNSVGIFRAYLRDREHYPLITSRSVPAPCLVLMRFNSRCVNHIGVYIGGGKVIHCRDAAGVSIIGTDDPFWRQAIVEYREVIQ
jgi:cell wall-associated NlpC family hydrolase